jgi:hypothetical protein
MADLTEAYAALQKADAAGDTAGAKQLADYIRSQSAPKYGTGRSLDVTADGQTVPTNSPQAKAAIDPSAGSGTLRPFGLDTGIPLSQGMNRFLAGAGKADMDLLRGAGQFVPTYRAPSLSGLITGDKGGFGTLVSRQDVANSRALDAPLMNTGAGKFGNLTSGILNTLPTLAIPGANTVTGAGLLGAGMGLLQPSTSTGETLTNTALGGVLSAGGQYLGNKVAGAVSNRLAARQAAANAEQSLNSARDAILAQSRAAGYVVPPTAVNDSGLATAAESIAGKAATRQAAEASNARVSDRLVAGDLNLPTNQPLTRPAIRSVIKNAGSIYGTVEKAGNMAADQPYIDAIANLTQMGADLEKAAPGIGAQANQKVKDLADSLLQPNFDAKDAVGLYRFLNERAKSNFKAGFGGDSQALELARAQRAAADAMGDLIQRNLTPDLANAWQDARTTIAKGYTALGALKGNHIDAIRLASQYRKDAPLTGGFQKVAQFADQFGEASRVPKSGAGVSKLAATIGGGGALGALIAGHPLGALGALGASVTPWAVRKGILSGAGQAALATPNYVPSLMGTTALNALGRAGQYGTLPGLAGTRALVQPAQQP